MKKFFDSISNYSIVPLMYPISPLACIDTYLKLKCFINVNMIIAAVIGKNDKLIEKIVKNLEMVSKFTGEDVKVFTTKVLSNYLDSYLYSSNIVIAEYDHSNLQVIEEFSELRKADPYVPLMLILHNREEAYTASTHHPFAVATVEDVDKLFTQEKIGSLLSAIKLDHSKSIAIKSRSDITKVRLDDISYIEVFGHNLSFHLKNKETITATGKMKTAEEELTTLGFFRCHDCYLVNLRNVEQLTANGFIVEGHLIPFSKRRKTILKPLIKKYFDGTSIYVFKGRD